MASIQPAQLHHFPAITDLNIEAYREYAANLTAEAWTTIAISVPVSEEQIRAIAKPQEFYLERYAQLAQAGKA